MSMDFFMGMMASLVATGIAKYFSYLWTHKTSGSSNDRNDVTTQKHKSDVKLEFLIAFPLTILCLAALIFLPKDMSELVRIFIFVIAFFCIILTWASFYCLVEIIDALKKQPATKISDHEIEHTD